ncbi:metallophosphoesterase [Acuticoccus sp. MNP-M23]|uniref:metallophosphoesterase family protein n=1 Tax=Acuticoccus sp. MNP-M23 TaxID=3072793 RepID=UPI0028151A2F|nr:metallophosphoesterase [Acuticoccus sp. MNP-M23]WMS41546.1 metallophosphoesterase [Acuticoccus sp. MNP-M23]
MTTRIAFVSDLHHGSDGPTRRGAEALDRLAQFKAFVAYEMPDAAVDLGDRITGEGADDAARAAEVAAIFRRFDRPVHHICGNHDVKNLSVADNAEILGQTLGHACADYGGWRLVLFRARARRRKGLFHLKEGDLDFLADTIRRADRPLVVASHIPLSGQNVAENPYFSKKPERSAYQEAGALRQVLLGATVPLVAIAGHVHWNSLSLVSGQPHITLQSATDSAATHPVGSGAYAMLTLSEERIAWRVHGEDPFAAEVATRSAGRRWLMED